jgi:hypothetical protein
VLGTVTSQSYFGHDVLVRMEVPGVAGPIAVRVSGQPTCGVGDRVVVCVTHPVGTYPVDGDVDFPADGAAPAGTPVPPGPLV